MAAEVWVATAPIWLGNVRAYNLNNVVPDSVVAQFGLEAEGLVERRPASDAGAPSHGVNPATQTELDAALAGITPAAIGALDQAAGDGRYPRKSDLVVNVRDYGAKGDGTTDDTAAIQSAVNDVIANSSTLLYPPGTYKITAPIVCGLGTNFHFDGPGATLKQTTNNTPIFRFTKEDTWGFSITGFTFSWTNFQPATNTAAIAIAFDPDTHLGHGVYNFTLRHLYASNGYSIVGILQATTVSNPIWGVDIEHMRGGVAMTGPVIELDQSAGAPHINIRFFYARRDQSTRPAIYITHAGVKIDGFEANNCTGTQLYLDTCSSVQIAGARVETCTVTTPGQAIFQIVNSQGSIDGAQFQTVTFNTGAGNSAYFLELANSSTFTVTAPRVDNTTITSGSVYAFKCASSNFVEINGYVIVGTAPTSTYPPDGSGTRVVRENNIFRRGIVHGQNIQTLGAAGAVTFNAQNGNIQFVTLNANATSSSVTNASAGQKLTIEWIQGAAGGFTYAWPPNCKFAGGAPPTASTTAGYHDSVTFRSDGTNLWEIGRAVAVR